MKKVMEFILVAVVAVGIGVFGAAGIGNAASPLKTGSGQMPKRQRTTRKGLSIMTWGIGMSPLNTFAKRSRRTKMQPKLTTTWHSRWTKWTNIWMRPSILSTPLTWGRTILI